MNILVNMQSLPKKDKGEVQCEILSVENNEENRQTGNVKKNFISCSELNESTNCIV